MRNCPICNSDHRELLYSHETTMRGHQDVYACLPCGMVYASVGQPVDYSESVYSEPQAVGSGDSPNDMKRLDESAAVISMYADKDAKVLDVGCGQGGMLSALQRVDFTNIGGIDLSHACCDATMARGFGAIPIPLKHVANKYNCIIFSHVLEHVEDPAALLRMALSKLEHDGFLYIEVPNAARYGDYAAKSPYLDFNSEHINHFNVASLLALIGKCGFEPWAFHNKTLTLSGGMEYPAMWVVAKRRESTRKMMGFVAQSRRTMNTVNDNLFEAFNKEGAVECILWGAGEYLAKIIDLPVFRIVKVVTIVDRNKSLHGKMVRGVFIQSIVPPNLPLVIASAANSKTIRKYIESQGITNKIIELEFS